MKTPLILALAIISFQAWSQAAFAEEGLKRVNYNDAAAELQTTPNSEASALTPEQQKKLMEEIDVLKARQKESQQALDEIDAAENEEE